MQKRAPTLGNMLVIILFVLSCFGLLLFLWESFGGPLPLKPKGYRFTVAFPRTLALAEQSDVRISGVDVGHVDRAASSARTAAPTRRSNSPASTRRSARTCTRSCARRRCSGETYVQLIPEGHSGPVPAPTAAQLADSQVEPSVTLDDILSAFDPKTRARLPDLAAVASPTGINGRGEQINAVASRRSNRSSNTATSC